MAACFAASTRDQGGRIVCDALGKTLSGMTRAQESDFEKRGPPFNIGAEKPQPQQGMGKERGKVWRRHPAQRRRRG